MNRYIVIRVKPILMILSFACLCSCSDFLDAQSNKRLVVPTKVQELQGVLDYYPRTNEVGMYPGEASADNYFVLEPDWNNMATYDRLMYIWADDDIFPANTNVWSFTYDNVYRANTVLEHIVGIPRTKENENDWDALKGHALFLRAKSFLDVAFTWCLAYDKETANTDIGIPLRLSADFNTPSVRASVEETYKQIIEDFKNALKYLPNQQITVMRPTKYVAYGYLAHAYLAMRDYENAELYADSALMVKGFELLDYNAIDSNRTYPFERFNKEVLYEERMQVPGLLNPSASRINKDLAASYHFNDLRRSLFFSVRDDNTLAFRGSYEGSISLFSGLTVAEVLLVSAEASVRNGNIQKGLTLLNELLEKRWKEGTFVNFETAKEGEALEIVLNERRKELVMRARRWMDLKRLNKEGANIVVKRTVGSNQYTLQPGDLAYALPIPSEIIEVSGIQQNPR